jgi:hypothetical protein
MAVTTEHPKVSSQAHAHCAGFDAFRRYPLYEAIFRRRTRRVSKGILADPGGARGALARPVA